MRRGGGDLYPYFCQGKTKTPSTPHAKQIKIFPKNLTFTCLVIIGKRMGCRFINKHYPHPPWPNMIIIKCTKTTDMYFHLFRLFINLILISFKLSITFFMHKNSRIRFLRQSVISTAIQSA